MGQYHKTVNLDKKEFIHPHKLASGLKLWEQLANSNGPGQALIVLLAHPDHRGGGDFNADSELAQKTIGRWRGDRIAIIGDYAEEGDIPGIEGIKHIYHLCADPRDVDAEFLKSLAEDGLSEKDLYTDVTDDVCKIIEQELGGKFTGTGWRDFVVGGE